MKSHKKGIVIASMLVASIITAHIQKTKTAHALIPKRTIIGDVRNLVIIGSGPAGLTASLYAARANLKPLVIEGELPGGQLTQAAIVNNWPGEKNIAGGTLMMNMYEQSKELGTEFLKGSVTQVDFSEKPFTLITDQNKIIKAHAVIIATGTGPKKIGCPGENTYWGKGVSNCAICDGCLLKDKPVAVVGGGSTGIKTIEYLKKFTNNITLIEKKSKLSAADDLRLKACGETGIKKMCNSTLCEIRGDGQRVTGITVAHNKSDKKTTIDVDGVFIATGQKPNTQPFGTQIDLNKGGYIKARRNTHTSIEGVFVAGNVRNCQHRQAITAAASGSMAALDAEGYLKK
jgi:thioredoxin reductase (NADPH)